MQDQLLNIYKLPRQIRCALLAVPLIFYASSSLAQGATASQASPQAAQIQMLTNQVTSLQQQLATLTQRLTKDEAARGGGIAPGPTGLSDADAKRLANLESRMNQLEASQKNKKEASDSVGTRVTAPFKVVDSNGVEILDVEAGGGSDFRGLRVYTMNDSFAELGSSQAGGSSNVSVHLPGDPSPRIAMGIAQTGKPLFMIAGLNHSTTVELAERGGGGELSLSNSGGTEVAVIGSNPDNNEGRAKFKDAGGKDLVRIGAAGDHGDVLLGDEAGKEVWVWEMTLTGFH